MKTDTNGTLELGFYYPGQYWHDADWIKNLVLFFDGVAMLIPKYMPDEASFEDYPLIAALKERENVRGRATRGDRRPGRDGTAG